MVEYGLEVGTRIFVLQKNSNTQIKQQQQQDLKELKHCHQSKDNPPNIDSEIYYVCYLFSSLTSQITFFIWY